MVNHGKGRLQTKLMVNEPGDIYEREADRVADQVMAVPEHTGVSGSPPRIQRFSGQSNGQLDAVPGSVDRVLAGSGSPLEPVLRQDMEQRFGHDFSRVRVHSDAAAGQSARDVSAHAYTVGHNIVFGKGAYQPDMTEGQRLLAHELTHVVQQRAGTQLIQRYDETTEANSRLEEGVNDLVSVINPIYRTTRAISSAYCLSDLEQPMFDFTFKQWIPRCMQAN